MIALPALHKLATDRRGSMAIETAFVAPVLILMSVGIFDTSMAVSRQHELQTAASEAQTIALASAQGATVKISDIEKIIAASLSLESDQVDVSRRYRCGAATDTVTSVDSCDEDDVVSSYLDISISDSYEPVWSSFATDNEVELRVERTVQIS